MTGVIEGRTYGVTLKLQGGWVTIPHLEGELDLSKDTQLVISIILPTMYYRLFSIFTVCEDETREPLLSQRYNTPSGSSDTSPGFW